MPIREDSRWRDCLACLVGALFGYSCPDLDAARIRDIDVDQT